MLILIIILIQVQQVPQQVSQVPQQVQPATQHTQFVYSNSQSPQQDLLSQSQQPSPGAQQAQQQSQQQQPLTPPCQQQLQQQQLQQQQSQQLQQQPQQLQQQPQQLQQQSQQLQQQSQQLQQQSQQQQCQQQQCQQQQSQQQQQPQQQQQLSKPPESSCSLGIDNSGTDSATISIKLPPSVLQDQKQLSNIVNTISKALHQPASSDPPKNEAAANSTNVGDQPPHVQPLTPPPQPFALKPPEASAATQNWSTAPSVVPPTDIPNTNWLDASDADDGFEQKRQKVSDNFVTNPEANGVVAPGVGVGVPNENAVVDSWTAQASQLAKPAWEQQSVVSTAPAGPPAAAVAPESVSGQASVVSWVTSSTVQDNSIASVTNWNQTVQTIAKISDSSVAPSIVPSTVSNGWNFSDKVENSVTSSVNLTAAINDASNDSGKCTKWENINAKPFDQPWSNTASTTNSILNSEDTSTIPVRNMTAPGVVAGNTSVNPIYANAEQTLQWMNKSEDKNWNTGSEAAVSSISESYTVSADTTWSNAEQVMDSTVGVGLSNAAGVVVSAEMIPVNPKEVSPMDVDDILNNRVPPSTSANNMIHQNTSALFVPASTLIETAVVTSLTPSVIAASTVQLTISPQNIISTTFPSCQ